MVTDLSQLKRDDVKVVDDDLASILAATIADYETRSKKVLQPAHIERLIINTFAYRETLARQQFNEGYRQQHPRFATGLMLDLCGDDVSTPRLSAQAALTTLRFSAPTLTALNATANGVTQINIPKGTRASVGELTYTTTENGVLTVSNNTADLTAICSTTGTAGNGWSIGQINTLVDLLHPTVEVQVANISVPSGGVADEEDDPYRERILLAPESFSIGGTFGAYRYFALEFSPAICDVEVGHVLDANGQPIGGTVALTVLTQTGLPSSELIDQLGAHLRQEHQRIVCDTVSVHAPTEVGYALNAQLVLFTGANETEVKTNAIAAWSKYEATRRKKLGGDIVPLDIQTVLKVAGVYNVILNNLPLTTVSRSEWAVCTSVNINIVAEQVDG